MLKHVYNINCMRIHLNTIKYICYCIYIYICLGKPIYDTVYKMYCHQHCTHSPLLMIN